MLITSRTPRIMWFLDVAFRTAQQATCIRRRYGAVIVDKQGHVIATGYNGAPVGMRDCLERGSCWREDHNVDAGCDYSKCFSVHSEQNALIQAGRDAYGSTIYIAGFNALTGNVVEALPCFQCTKMLINAGVVLIVSAHMGGDITTIPPVDRYITLEAELLESINDADGHDGTSLSHNTCTYKL